MRNNKGFTLLELLVVASIIAIIAAIAIPQLLNARRSAWENRAKLTLRALGSSQLAYQDSNLDKNYGNFGDMLGTDYVQAGYTRGNMIDNYSISVFYRQASNQINGASAADGGFTIVAVPRSNKNRLRTFAVCDDQTVRVATNNTAINPANDLGGITNTPADLNIESAQPSFTAAENPCNWEPLR